MATLSISTIQTLCRSLVGLVGVILLFSSQAKAECICDNSADLETLIEDADLIFRGELRSLSEDWEGCTRTGGWNYAMEAYEVFKGKAEARINIRSQAPGDNSCGIPVEREGEFLVYATKVNEYNEYESTICMGTKTIQEATDDLDLLGPGEEPEYRPMACSSLVLTPQIMLLGLFAIYGLKRRRVRN